MLSKGRYSGGNPMVVMCSMMVGATLVPLLGRFLRTKKILQTVFQFFPGLYPVPLASPLLLVLKGFEVHKPPIFK